MKRTLKIIVFEVSYYLELLISVILAVAIFAMSWQFFLEIIDAAGNSGADLTVFLGKAMTLAVGVEFIKMLCKHTPSTVIEVLLFATARQMVVEHLTAIDTLIGVIALAALFATRKYLFCSFDETDRIIFRGSQTVKAANRLAKTKIPLEEGETLSEVIVRHLNEEERTVAIGSCVYLNDIALRVDHMHGDSVTRVELIKMV